MVIQDLLNPNELPIKKGLHRMFLIAGSMQKDAIRALKTVDHDLALDVSQRDDEVDRLCLLNFKAVSVDPLWRKNARLFRNKY